MERGATGPSAAFVQSPGECRAFVDQVVSRFWRLDSLVANAGIGLYEGIEDTSDDDLARMIEVNFSGTVWSIRAAVPQLRRQGDGGDLVVVSSVAGLRGGADEAVYAGTKFAQVGLAGSLDRELREDGIRVTAICPA
jgi:3-oxoacyl-[acyl-carrier protein] reductase